MSLFGTVKGIPSFVLLFIFIPPLFLFSWIFISRRIVHPIAGRSPPIFLTTNIFNGIALTSLLIFILTDSSICVLRLVYVFTALIPILLLYLLRVIICLFNTEIEQYNKLLYLHSSRTLILPTAGEEEMKEITIEPTQELLALTLVPNAPTDISSTLALPSPTSATITKTPRVSSDGVDGSISLPQNWYVRNKKLISRESLIKTFMPFFLFILTFLPIFILLNEYSSFPLDEVSNCSDYSPIHSSLFSIRILALIFLLPLCVLVARLPLQNDVYSHRAELTYTALTVSALCIVQLCADISDSLITDVISVALLLILFLLNTIYPLGLSYYYQQNQKALADFKEINSFSDLLSTPMGYSSFLSFLKTEYSTENILFWRGVNEFVKLAQKLDDHYPPAPPSPQRKKSSRSQSLMLRLAPALIGRKDTIMSLKKGNVTNRPSTSLNLHPLQAALAPVSAPPVADSNPMKNLSIKGHFYGAPDEPDPQGKKNLSHFSNPRMSPASSMKGHTTELNNSAPAPTLPGMIGEKRWNFIDSDTYRPVHIGTAKSLRNSLIFTPRIEISAPSGPSTVKSANAFHYAYNHDKQHPYPYPVSKRENLTIRETGLAKLKRISWFVALAKNKRQELYQQHQHPYLLPQSQHSTKPSSTISLTGSRIGSGQHDHISSPSDDLADCTTPGRTVTRSVSLQQNSSPLTPEDIPPAITHNIGPRTFTQTHAHTNSNPPSITPLLNPPNSSASLPVSSVPWLSVVRALLANKAYDSIKQSDLVKEQKDKDLDILKSDIAITVQTAIKLYEVYVTSSSSNQLNLPDSIVKDLKEKMSLLMPQLYSKTTQVQEKDKRMSMRMMTNIRPSHSSPAPISESTGLPINNNLTNIAGVGVSIPGVEVFNLGFRLSSIFTPARLAIESLMECDSFPRYVRSTHFTSFCDSYKEKARKIIQTKDSVDIVNAISNNLLSSPTHHRSDRNNRMSLSVG